MQKERKESIEIQEEVDNIELESSFVSKGPELNPNQRTSQIVFMILQALHTVLTVSLGPLYGQIALHYKVSENQVHILYGLSVLACLAAFIPTNQIIGKHGLKTGMFICLAGAVVGGGLCCLINTSFLVFQIGYFLMQFWMQGIHAAKGFFVNLYFPEKRVKFFLSNFREEVSISGSLLSSR